MRRDHTPIGGGTKRASCGNNNNKDDDNLASSFVFPRLYLHHHDLDGSDDYVTFEQHNSAFAHSA
jgi:hypothetical protein